MRMRHLRAASQERSLRGAFAARENGGELFAKGVLCANVLCKYQNH